MAELVHLYGNGGELEWLGWFLDQGFLSRDEMRRQLDMFATHIIPRFKDVGKYDAVAATAAS